jgi:hypothetical protein
MRHILAVKSTPAGVTARRNASLVESSDLTRVHSGAKADLVVEFDLSGSGLDSVAGGVQLSG